MMQRSGGLGKGQQTDKTHARRGRQTAEKEEEEEEEEEGGGGEDEEGEEEQTQEKAGLGKEAASSAAIIALWLVARCRQEYKRYLSWVISAGSAVSLCWLAGWLSAS